MRLTLADYLMGRDQGFPADCTPLVLTNAQSTIERANALIAVLEAEGIAIEQNPKTATPVSSGWRPPQLNAAVPNAAPRSKHMTGEAVDIFDPEGEIDTWLMSEAGQRALIAARLYLEHPSATKGWTHWQTVAPKSGNRVFYP
jgi:hypothetical protein